MIPTDALRPVRAWAASLVAGAPAGWCDFKVSSTDATAVPALVPELVQQVRSAVARTFSRPFSERGWTLIAKAPRIGGATPWHQDGAYLGGGMPFDLVTAWLPITDVDERSACLRYAPLTLGYDLLPHAAVPETAADPIPTLAADPPTEVTAASVSCPMSAGDLMLHIPRTLHASHPNLSTEARLAFVVDLVTRPWEGSAGR